MGHCMLRRGYFVRRGLFCWCSGGVCVCWTLGPCRRCMLWRASLVPSIVVRHACSRVMAVAVRQGSCEVAGKGFLVGCEVRHLCFCHSVRQWWCGQFRSHHRVVLVQVQFSSFDPRFAGLSACSLPLMPTCDGVHFPLTLQPLCLKIFIFFRHALTYSLPAVGPPARAPGAFWLSTQRKIVWLLLFLVTSSLWLSCIPCISPSSMSALVPIWQCPPNIAMLLGSVTECQALLVTPSSFFDPSVYRRMVLLSSVVEWSFLFLSELCDRRSVHGCLQGLGCVFEGRAFSCYLQE